VNFRNPAFDRPHLRARIDCIGLTPDKGSCKLAIIIGTPLGFLEITALLGRGGMGDVYCAGDAKLKRDVAIKILPDEFSRFQREAEVHASLNQPTSQPFTTVAAPA